MIRRLIWLPVLAGLVISACNPSAGDPRGAVIKFLSAVSSADTLTILRGITVKAPYTILPDTGLADAGARADTVMVARLIQELSIGGELHKRWQTHRMVVGDAEVRGDSALVEVTRMDQSRSVRVYNKFGLVANNGYWQIYSFMTRPGPTL